MGGKGFSPFAGIWDSQPNPAGICVKQSGCRNLDIGLWGAIWIAVSPIQKRSNRKSRNSSRSKCVRLASRLSACSASNRYTELLIIATGDLFCSRLISPCHSGSRLGEP
jgi:hypothetical protein